MGEEVKMDDVGNAEAVLVRLINERKALEAAQQVLMTYRMVKGRLEPAVAELKEVENKIEAAKVALDGVEVTKARLIERVNSDVALYKERKVNEVQKEIDELNEVANEIRRGNELMEAMNEGEMKEYVEKKEMMVEELRGLQEQLAVAKKEHAALAEAISNAAVYFKV